MDSYLTEYRTRFAPSPTGYVHIGSLRTGLYAYLAARANKGKIILRIEDTDQTREIEDAAENLLKVFDYLGVKFDEGSQIDGKEIGKYGPYTQSKRKDIHIKYAQDLVDSGHAYHCFCSKERLDELREKQKSRGLAPMYDRHCLKLSKEEVEKRINAGEPYVIRQKIPSEIIKFKDLVYGNIQFDGKKIDDQVLIKSDGFPTYHLGNVVDDHLMKISHVIRGEDWIPSTPKHIALYQAFGWEIPKFAHLPLILNKDRSKQSKRKGDFSVDSYIKKGYTKEALINFVAMLGWNPGNGEKQEIFSLKELEEIFSLKKVNKSGAIFDLEKLNWVNWQWKKRNFNKEISKKAKEIDENVKISEDKRKNLNFEFSNKNTKNTFLNMKGELLLEEVNQYIDQSLIEKDHKKLLKALITVEDKILKEPKEAQNLINFYFTLPKYEISLLSHEKMKVDKDLAQKAIKASIEDLEKLNDWTLENIQDTLINTVKRLDLKNGQVFWPVRVALSGLQYSPGVFELAWTLEKQETLNRLNHCLTLEK